MGKALRKNINFMKRECANLFPGSQSKSLVANGCGDGSFLEDANQIRAPNNKKKRNRRTRTGTNLPENIQL